MTEPDSEEHDHDGRRRLTPEQRFDLLERDVRSHARSIGVLTKTIATAGDSFSEKQLEQLRDVVRIAFADVGLRIDDADHVDDAREDLRFLRKFRQSWDGAAKKVGGVVLTAIAGVALTIIGAGFWAWISSRGHP